MQFKHTQTRDDGGGHLTIVAETQSEMVECNNHFRIFDLSKAEGVSTFAAQLAGGPPWTIERKPEKRLWFKVESALDYDFTKPYEDLLRKITGFDGQMILEADLTALHPRHLCHTHITDRLYLDQGHICFVGFIRAEEWNKRSAADNADLNFADYTAEDFGFRRFEREFIEDGSGRLKKNPNYLKRYKAQPGLGAPWLWSFLWQWWRDNHATPEQEAILKSCERLKAAWNSGHDWELRKGGGDQCSLVGYSIYYDDPNGTCNWDGKGKMASVITWDKFAKLAKAKEVAGL